MIFDEKPVSLNPAVFGSINQLMTTATGISIPSSKPFRVPITFHRCVEPPEDGVWADA